MKKAVLGSLIIAMIHSILFYGQDLGISVLLFAIPSVYFLIGLLKKYNKIKNKNALYLCIPIFLLSSTYLIFNNEFFNMLNMIIIPLLIGCMIVWTTTDMFKLKELFLKTVSLVMGSLEFIPNSINIIKKEFKTNKTIDEQKHKKIKLIGIGIICSIPLLFIIIGLLMSADGMFATIFSKLFTNLETIFNSKLIINLVGRIIVITIVTIYSVCIIYNITNKNSSYNSTHKASEIFKFNIDQTIVNTILTIVNIVYLIFSIIQFLYVGSYAFYGVAKILDINLADYARQGFFQLMFITFINFVIIILTNSNKKSEEKKSYNYTKIMNMLMCIFTIVIAISAFMRMRLYEKEYGYTFLRLMVYFILTTEVIMIIPTIMYILKGKINLFKSYFIILTAMYIVINFTNIDYQIARNNANRVIKSEGVIVRDLDVHYLTYNLGTDATSEMIRIYKNVSDPNDKRVLKGYLYNIYTQTSDKIRSPQEFNLSKNRAERLLKEVFKQDNMKIENNKNGEKKYI